jgi:hypothetical protein
MLRTVGDDEVSHLEGLLRLSYEAFVRAGVANMELLGRFVAPSVFDWRPSGAWGWGADPRSRDDDLYL